MPAPAPPPGSCAPVLPEIGALAAQRRSVAARLTAVIAQPGSPPGRRLLLELLLRGVALAVMALLILGLLPVIVGAAS